MMMAGRTYPRASIMHQGRTYLASILATGRIVTAMIRASARASSGAPLGAL